MQLTDPTCLPILLIASAIIGTIGFITGSACRGIRARREQMKLWSDAERLYRARSVIDLRDRMPR